MLVKIIVAVAILLFVWLIYSMGSLRVFVPEYFKLAGFANESKNYLIIFQNNNEIRPAGGFITAYGMAKFNHGIFQGLKINDVYASPNTDKAPRAPYPLDRFLDQNGRKIAYSFRDANFDPDFPDSAKRIEEMLKYSGQKEQIDGVIAVNYSFLEDLLAKTGAMEVDGITFDKDSLFSNLEYVVNNIDKHDIEDLENRKNILKDFSKKLTKKIIFKPWLLDDVLEVATESMRKKDIQMYFKNQTLQNIAVSHGWSGQWPLKIDGDFLALNEANLGGLKADRYMSRDVNYDLKVEKKDGDRNFSLKAKASVKIKNFGSDNIPVNGKYEGYIRFYIPKSAIVKEIDKQNLDELREEDLGSLHVFEAMIKINPGEEKSFSYSYELPSDLLEDESYSLFIPKQSGSRNDSYSATIQFPNDYRVESHNFQVKENIAIYNGMPDEDLNLNLKFSKDKQAPLIINQNIDSLDQISVFFNENLSPVSKDNFKIEDANIKVSDLTDKIQITSIELSEKKIILKISGMRRQDEERYFITLVDLKDLNGNLIAPNPRKITVVQRLVFQR